MSENIIYCYSGSGNCLDMAINVGKITVRRARFHNANVKATDLMEKVIYID